MLVAVDVGHWPGAPGVLSASGRPELEFNRELAHELKVQLEKSGLEVRMIEDLPALRDRTRMAQGADLLVSIHHDAVRAALMPRAERYSGFSLFVSRQNPQPARSLACAAAIGAELRAAGLEPSRYHAEPVPGENRPYADETNGVHYFDNLALARGAAMPAVLVEAGVRRCLQ